MMRKAFDLTFRAPMNASLSFAASLANTKPRAFDGLHPMTKALITKALTNDANSKPRVSEGLSHMTHVVVSNASAMFDQEVEALARKVFSESRYESLRSKWTGMTNPLVGDPRKRQLARDAEAFFSDERFEKFERIWGDRKVVNPLAGKSESPQFI